MAATYPLTLEGWNGLLERINALATNPPEGCDPVEELPLVTAPHKWSEADITAARDKLVEICSNNTFSSPSTGKWLKAIIDELDAAIDNGWCGCEEEELCCVPQGSGTVQINPGGYYVTIPFSQIVEQYLYGYARGWPRTSSTSNLRLLAVVLFKAAVSRMLARRLPIGRSRTALRPSGGPLCKAVDVT